MPERSLIFLDAGAVAFIDLMTCLLYRNVLFAIYIPFSVTKPCPRTSGKWKYISMCPNRHLSRMTALELTCPTVHNYCQQRRALQSVHTHQASQRTVSLHANGCSINLRCLGRRSHIRDCDVDTVVATRICITTMQVREHGRADALRGFRVSIFPSEGNK